MGLYIDMEMPKEIEPALVIDFCEDPDGRRYARFYHYRYGGLMDWHEVLEVPEPHGRLIDADALTDNWYYSSAALRPDDVKKVVCLDDIDNAPTIIKSEENNDQINNS